MTHVTFAEQSALWLRELEQRKRKPVSPATIRAFGAYVRTLVPMIGDMPLASVNNSTAKAVVAALCEKKLSAKTINEVLATLKSVVASVIDPVTGDQLFPVRWNSRYIDAPTVGAQRQPWLTADELKVCIKNAVSNQEKLFYSVLAGSGLRVSEALAIRVAVPEDQTSWDQDSGWIRVRSSVYQSKEQLRLKTPSARRTIDLDPQLNDLIATYVALNKIQSGAFLFQSRTHHSMYLVTATARLAKHGDRAKGFHAFRRYRITRLREMGCPEDILRFWVGHSAKGITDRYSKLSENAELRKQWAAKCGLGFDLPELCAGRPAPKPIKTKPASSSKPSQPVAPPEATEAFEPQPSVYSAVDSDLPELFFEPSERVA